MSRELQLTFVPGRLVPAGGAMVCWHPDGRAPGDQLRLLDVPLPVGEAGELPTLAVDDGGITPVARPARWMPVLPVVRQLAVLPAGPELPAWSRPSASVLAWSVAAKLGLELVARGQLVPTLAPAGAPTEGRASWRIAAGDDPRLEQLAAALPPAATALRRPDGSLWEPAELLGAFLDAVADACARAGRRPELDPRRRGPRRAWAAMWLDALTGSDPTVSHLRLPAEDIARELADWSAPLLGRDPQAVARVTLRLTAPVDPAQVDPAQVDAAERSWRLGFGLQHVQQPDQRVAATEVWAAPLGEVTFGEVVLPDAPAVLARGLAAAARLFPPVERALAQAQPVEVELTVAEVAELVADGAAALAAGGLTVELPPELRTIGSERLRLRVRLGAVTPSGPRVDGAGPLGLSSLTDLRYEHVLGDELLTDEEVAELVAARSPLVRWRGRWVRVDHDELDRIGELVGRSSTIGATEALAAALTGQLHLDELGWVETVADGRLGVLVTQLRREEGPGEARVVGIEGTLRPYQRRGVAWMQRLAELGLGGVLADEMGLGKTLQAIAVLAARDQDRPHLVVCPTSVVGNWQRELARFAPGLEVVRHHGADREVDPAAFGPGVVVVTSYALLRRDQELLEEVGWDVLVLDEAQQIKNPASKGARAARALDARVRVAMTGTPLENRVSELWSIVDVTNPGLLGSQRSFAARFGVPIERWHDEDAAQRLRRLVAPFVLRRRKDDDEVAIDLPPKQEQTVVCALTREQVSLYQDAVDRAFTGDGLGATAFERRGRILALLTALKQICNHPAQYLGERDGAGSGPLRLAGRSGKLTRATEILGEVVDAGERALVFTQFRVMGELLVTHLGAELGLPEVPFLHGGVTLPARDAMTTRFQDDDDAPPLLVVSLRAGGTGLNLTRASQVVHVDRWWNPAVEDQATDRVHRIGQTRAVTVHRLVTAGTIEERIAELLDRKRALADAVIGTGEAWITELGDAELRELVELSTVGPLADEDDDGDVRTEVAGRPQLTALPGGRS